MNKKISLVLLTAFVIFTSSCGIGKSINKNSNDLATENVQEEVSENFEWKQFLKEYEDWVDKYIEITKKYKENSTDITILSDYTKMLNELSEWTEKTEEAGKKLEEVSPSELAEFSSELSRISAKILEITG